MKVTSITLGCKVNQYETEAMLEQLTKGGFSICNKEEPADVVVINSCTVTGTSDHKVKQTLHKARRHNPDAVIVLTGCMPQAFPEEATELSEADVVLGNSNRSALLASIMEYLNTKQRVIQIVPHAENDAFESLTIENFHEHTRAFIKIQDGCNRFCSYCIIPYARGRVRSKPLADLIAEVQTLAENGYQEIVLTGINLSAYGQDLNLTLCDAIEATCNIPAIKRVRLGSLEPERLSLHTIGRLAKQEKLCPQFHLSLQSGCNQTLTRMNRHYTTNEYQEIVQNLRSAFSNASITTDIMVGFPGETEEEFTSSLAFAKEIGFAKVHVFAYSRRPGTKANEYPNQLTNPIKEERSKKMIELTKQSKINFLNKQIGTTSNVLFERLVAPNEYEGYTKNYTPVRASSLSNLCGTIKPIIITDATTTYCIAKIITTNEK